MVPVRAIVKGWRKGISRLDAAAVDKEDAEAVEEYEKRRGTKHGIVKAPFVLANLFKKMAKPFKKAGATKEQGQRQPAAAAADPKEAPDAVPAGYAVL